MNIIEVGCKLKIGKDDEYFVIDMVKLDGNKYVYLASGKENDTAIQKVVEVNGKECLQKVSDEELDKVVQILASRI